MTADIEPKRVFHSLKEVKETLFPNVPLEELEGEATDERVQAELRRFAEIARRRSETISSKKVPG